MNKWLYDTENDEFISQDEMSRIFHEELTDEDRQGRTFEEYLTDCTAGNGTLVPVPEKRNGRDYIERHSGRMMTYEEVIREISEWFTDEELAGMTADEVAASLPEEFDRFRKIEIN